MNYTTNYNLNKPEGTDLYNHLTIDNPNMDTIDTAMHANKLQAIGNATELVSGTVHAITRSDGDQNIFRFKATGDFKVGDTITVDGVSVNAYTTGGQQLPNDAYVLSAEVICILDTTNLWVITNKTLDASDIPYDNSNVYAEITNLNTNKSNKDELVSFTKNVSLISDTYLGVRKIGSMVIGAGRFHLQNNKPSGQEYPLYTSLPIPTGLIIPVVVSNTAYSLLINASGELTSNDAIPAGWYNISFCYLTA